MPLFVVTAFRPNNPLVYLEKECCESFEPPEVGAPNRGPHLSGARRSTLSKPDRKALNLFAAKVNQGVYQTSGTPLFWLCCYNRRAVKSRANLSFTSDEHKSFWAPWARLSEIFLFSQTFGRTPNPSTDDSSLTSVIKPRSPTEPKKRLTGTKWT